MVYLQVVLFSVFSALFLFLLARLIGYRQVSELTVFDYINSITIGSIAAELSTSEDWETAARCTIGLVIYAALTLLLSFICLKSARLRRYALGEAAVLMKNGRLVRENFTRGRINLNEFLMQCRNAGQFDLSELDTVYLEANGRISILPRPEERPATPADLSLHPQKEEIPVPVIMDGEIQDGNLRALGFEEKWLGDRLREAGVRQDEVFLATAAQGGAFWFSRAET